MRIYRTLNAFYVKIMDAYFSDRHLVEVVRGAVLAVMVRGLGIIATIAFNLAIGRLYGVEGAGVIILALTLCGVVSVVARIGLDAVALRFVASSVAQKRWVDVGDAYLILTNIIIVVSIVLAAVVWFIAPWLSEDVYESSGLSQSLRILAFTVPAVALLALHAEMLRGLKLVVQSQLLQNTVTYIVAVPLAFLLSSVSSHFLEMGYLISTIITLAIAVVIWHNVVPSVKKIKLESAFHLFNTLLKQSPPFFITQLLDLVNLWAGVIVLGMLSTDSQVGLFGMAARMAVLAAAVLVAVNVIVAPKFAALHALGDLKAIEVLARRTTGLIVLTTTPVLLILFFLSEEVMGYFGDGFEAGAVYLQILTLGHLVNVIAGPVGYLLTMTGYTRLQKRATLMGAMVNVALCVALIPSLGGGGAAIALAASLIVQNALGIIFVHRCFNFWIVPGLTRIIPERF